MFTITCPRCDGGDANCKRCEGSGRAMLYQCPRKAITDDARVLMRAYRDYERGFLPAPGAMEDQAAGFSRWISLIDAERNSIEEERAALRRARGRGASLPTSEGD